MTEADLDRYFIQRQAPYIKPFYSIDYKDKDKILTWYRETDEKLSEYCADLFREQRENWGFVFSKRLAIGSVSSPYIGAYSSVADSYAQPDDVYVNECYRLIRSQISLIVSNELVPDVLPSTDEYASKVACNITKEWLQSINYDLNLDGKRFEWELYRKIMGECYIIPQWDPNKGDLLEESREETEEEMEFLDEEGKAIKDLYGNAVKIKNKVRIGDITLVTPRPFNVQIDPQERFENSNWFYYKEWVDVEYLKKKYPKLDFQTVSPQTEYDPHTGIDKDSPNRRMVWYFYHKAHEFLPEGRYIVGTLDHILINEPMALPTLIDSQDLPIVRLVDLEVESGIRGIPITMRNIKSLNTAYNRITNQVYNNLELESPKIFVHESSGVDAQRMPNGVVVCEWRGNVKPTVETPTTNTSSIFKFREDIKKDMDEMAFQTPMVRGDVPNAQLDSFIALQHFEDQRVQLASPEIKGHIKALEKLFKLEICIARDKYHPDDKRLMKILGKHNTYQLKYFDPTNLDKSYDVKITTTGNLANSKAARTQLLMTIKREFPTLLTNESFLDMLGLSHSQKFMNAITSAVSSAEAENADMYAGKEIKSPARFEDLITHWDTHRIPMQTLDFKQSPPYIQEQFIRHMTATEKLMFEQASESPTFAQRLQGLNQFPIFYTPVPLNEVPQDQMIRNDIPPEQQILPTDQVEMSPEMTG